MEPIIMAEGETHPFAFTKNQLDCTQEELFEALDRMVHPKDCDWRSDKKDLPAGTEYWLSSCISPYDRAKDVTIPRTSIFISSATGKCYSNEPDKIGNLIKCHRLSKKLGLETPTFNYPNRQAEALEDASLLMEWLRGQVASLLDEADIPNLRGGSIRFELRASDGTATAIARPIEPLLADIRRMKGQMTKRDELLATFTVDDKAPAPPTKEEAGSESPAPSTEAVNQKSIEAFNDDVRKLLRYPRRRKQKDVKSVKISDEAIQLVAKVKQSRETRPGFESSLKGRKEFTFLAILADEMLGKGEALSVEQLSELTGYRPKGISIGISNTADLIAGKGYEIEGHESTGWRLVERGPTW